MAGKYVAYIRVSTAKQGASGLGLEAQRMAVDQFMARMSGTLVAEVREIESGGKNDRPRLADALTLCRVHGGTLIIAKLDRLARNVHFISGLMEAGVDFVACDFPQANRLTIHVLAAVAEHEREMISARTVNRRRKLTPFGPRIGVQFCPPCLTGRRVVQVVHRRGPSAPAALVTKLAEGALGRFLWTHLGNPAGVGVRGRDQLRLLKRQLSLPVSMMSQWWVRRSSRAVVILASPKTEAHSAKARLVVMTTAVRS